MKRKRPLAFVAAVAGISLVTPYVLSQLAHRFPKSPLATLNSELHKGSQ